VLISNNTLVDIDPDINFHARASKETGVLPLRRTANKAFHYKDEANPHTNSEAAAFLTKDRPAPASKERRQPHNDGCQCQPNAFPNLTEVGICHITRRKPMVSRKGRSNPKKDKKHKVSIYYCYMSEIELQGLLDRTNPLDDDEEAMDMIVLDGLRISKFDIKALKVGKNVPFEMKEELKKFNSKFLGKVSVFPTKNGAPRILT
jgi:hypothetical protein